MESESEEEDDFEEEEDSEGEEEERGMAAGGGGGGETFGEDDDDVRHVTTQPHNPAAALSSNRGRYPRPRVSTVYVSARGGARRRARASSVLDPN